jgi:hypothetical protein
MAVRDCERHAVVAQDGVEDLADWDRGAVRSTLADRHDAAEAASRAERDRQNMLAAKAPQLAHGDGREIGAPAHRRRGRPGLEACRELQRRDERRSLGRPDAGVDCELLRRRLCELGQAAVYAEQRSGKLERALASPSVSDHQGEQLGIA